MGNIQKSIVNGHSELSNPLEGILDKMREIKKRNLWGQSVQSKRTLRGWLC